jgi:hypothetical protein
MAKYWAFKYYNKTPKTQTVLEINKALRQLTAHVGIHGNEAADLLAKKGTTLYKSNQTLEAHEAKTIIKNKILKNAKLKMTTKISGKQMGQYPSRLAIKQ